MSKTSEVSLSSVKDEIMHMLNSMEQAVTCHKTILDEMKLLNKSQLRKMGLTTTDINKLEDHGCAVVLDGRAHPLFQAKDVQVYIDNRKPRVRRRRYR